jgi:hypothetical protein
MSAVAVAGRTGPDCFSNSSKSLREEIWQSPTWTVAPRVLWTWHSGPRRGSAWWRWSWGQTTLMLCPKWLCLWWW